MPGARKQILVTCLVLLTLGIPSMEVGGEGLVQSRQGQQGREMGLCAFWALSLLSLCRMLP